MKGKLSVVISEKQHTYELEIPFFAEGKQVITAYQSTTFCAAIELAGPITAVRAAWANLVKGGREPGQVCQSGVFALVGGEWHNIAVIGKHKFVTQTIDGHMLLVAPEASGKNRSIFFGGSLTEPSPYFIDSLRINVQSVPVLRDWVGELWTRGIEKNAVKQIHVYGSSMLGWQIHDGWDKVVKEMVLAWRN